MDHVKTQTSSDMIQLTGLQEEAESLNRAMSAVSEFLSKVYQEDPSLLVTAARDFAYSLAHVYIGETSCLLGIVSQACSVQVRCCCRKLARKVPPVWTQQWLEGSCCC